MVRYSERRTDCGFDSHRCRMENLHSYSDIELDKESGRLVWKFNSLADMKREVNVIRVGVEYLMQKDTPPPHTANVFA